MNAIDLFRAAMRAHGLNPPEIIEPGKLHRFGSNGKRHDDAGWCKLFPDCGGGVFGDFRSGLSEAWQAQREKPFTSSERKAFRQRCEAERKAREAEQARAHAKAREKAAEILKGATGDPAAHPYAIKKKVGLGPLVRRGLWPQRGWTDALLVPLYDGEGCLSAVEAINVDGDKDFLKGSKTSGCFYPFGQVRGADRVLVGEGLASVAACVAASPSPAVAALSASFLKAAALAVLELAPKADVVLVADNDDPGLKAAKEAAAAVNGRVAVPELDGRKCDFWDVWNERGVEAIHDLIYRSGSQEKGTKPPGGQEDIIEAAIAKLSADIGAIFEPQVIEALKAVRVQPRRLPALSEAHQGCGRSCFGARSPGVCDWERGHGRGPRRRSPHRAREGPQWGRGSSAGHSCERWRAPAARFGRH